MADNHKHNDECKCPKWPDVWKEYVERTGWTPNKKVSEQLDKKGSS